MGAEPALTELALMQARHRLLKMHYDAGCGHIGGNLSAIDSLILLYKEYISQSDRLVLSKGHAAGALYVALWSIGMISDEELQTFHKNGTKLAAHPPPFHPGVEFATGSLGHGLSLAAGLAFSKKLTKADGQVYCLTSDGEWQEGSTWEALIFAAHRCLSMLTVLIDKNDLQGFGSTRDVASMHDLESKLRGFDVAISVVEDGHDLNQLRNALAERRDRPHVIIMNTIKGHGISFMENEMKWHYLPMTKEQFRQAEIEVGVP